MLWDRNLIAALWDFRYSWEIYTPAEKRKYGYYVLPMLYGDRFTGRIEMAVDTVRDTLTVRNVWYESSVRKTKALQAALDRSVQRFAVFNHCSRVVRMES